MAEGNGMRGKTPHPMLRDERLGVDAKAHFTKVSNITWHLQGCGVTSLWTLGRLLHIIFN